MLSDTQLLTQLQAGDDVSFETLFLRHYNRVHAILYRLLGDQADADDIAQQVFLKLYHTASSIQTPDHETNVVGWLYRVAVNAGYNELRSRKRRRSWLEKLAGFSLGDAFAPNPAHLAETATTQARVRQTLAEMKPRDAKLLLLRHSGLSYKELASVLNIAPGSIGSLLTRAERTFAKKHRAMFPEEANSL